ncbi:DUF1826 domain-containing protein [Acetobacter senegalensis]|uniref:DUF1826 domain-containing protein n=1 Tax=Acetobacter senegalensis TaxID=446692 RepID=UPI001EDC64C7|nr:DUF1826 domain-containing protein [Acetobacter senegalensis]MCG4258272.1 DUF1826 domain-containing protein [Acetobacter senegalensis]MCG4268282.1 DUF1826 domain-containing protein [Acetobacter senegalensis]
MPISTQPHPMAEISRFPSPKPESPVFNDQGRPGAMLFMESWPAPKIDTPEDAALACPAPHVVACAHAAVVMDLQRPDVDMVVWGRRVPMAWEISLTEWSSSSSPLTLFGTPSEIADCLATPAVRQDWPPVILTDVRDLSSLFGALTGGVRQHIRLMTPPSGEAAFELPPDVLRLICGYGRTGAEWCCSQDPKSGIVSALSPFAVAFIKGAAEGEPSCLHRLPANVPNGAMPGPILVMDTVSR